MTTYTVTMKTVDGKQMTDPETVALLFGVEPGIVRALHVIKDDAALSIPQVWLKRGSLRAKEALLHTGSSAMVDCLRYWAAKDYGATLKVIYE